MIEKYLASFSTGIFSSLITSRWHRERREAEIVDFPVAIPQVLVDFLRANGYQGLYTHQTDSINALTNKKNLVVATGTSSGKTLCYNLPVISTLLKDPSSTALYIFPTKALTEDQYKKIGEVRDYLKETGIDCNVLKPGIYDGDTNSSKRTAIRNNSNIILTNPDMLHLGILPHHTSWARFLGNLNYIVLDEVHTYRGVFGSHVANVMRRLKRILSFYGAHPQFVLASATIQNPLELARKLTEEDFVCISR